MNKFYIVEGIEFDSKFKNEEEIKDLKWKAGKWVRSLECRRQNRG